MRRNSNWRGLVMFGISILVIILDQWSKTWVRATLAEGASWDPIPALASFVTFTHTHNTGVAFGLFQGRGMLFAFVNVAIVLAIVFYFRRLATSSWVLLIALGLQMGGAIGNLIDRLARGYVTDFVNVHVFAVFNVADSGIVVGAFMLGFYALFMDRDKPASEPAIPPTPDEPSPEAQ